MGASDGSVGYFLSVSILQAFVDVWSSLVTVLIYGGWLGLVFVLVRMYLILHREEARKKFGQKIEWVFLSLSIPEMPTQSILAAEQLFAQLHTTRKKYKWQDVWIKGKLGTLFSFEIVSLGGLVRYIIRTSREHADTVRAAVFAQYPNAEISEVGDYMDAFSMPFNPSHVDYDIYGTELSLDKSDAYPIKTYPSFEHRAAETIVD